MRTRFSRRITRTQLNQVRQSLDKSYSAPAMSLLNRPPGLELSCTAPGIRPTHPLTFPVPMTPYDTSYLLVQAQTPVDNSHNISNAERRLCTDIWLHYIVLHRVFVDAENSRHSVMASQVLCDWSQTPTANSSSSFDVNTTNWDYAIYYYNVLARKGNYSVSYAGVSKQNNVKVEKDGIYWLQW